MGESTVHTEVSSPLYVEALRAYRFQKRSADTTVRLQDGETMVIGGLIGSEETRSLSKIPFLGDLPILGAFFRSVRTSKSESEIMIFLTAQIKRQVLTYRLGIRKRRRKRQQEKRRDFTAENIQEKGNSRDKSGQYFRGKDRDKGWRLRF